VSDRKHSRWGPKLTQAGVLDIVDRCRTGETQKAVASDYAVTKVMVSRIMSGLSWSNVTGIEPHKPGHARGEFAPGAKLTRDQVSEIVRRCEAGEGCDAVARDFPVGEGQVGSIMCGKAWSHVTGIESADGAS